VSASAKVKILCNIAVYLRLGLAPCAGRWFCKSAAPKKRDRTFEGVQRRTLIAHFREARAEAAITTALFAPFK
jgi:hypothetical protein